MDKFELKIWNGQYYCSVKFPNGLTLELKSTDDLTYTQWKEKIEKVWNDSQIPEPPAECLCGQCEVDEKNCPRLKAVEISK